MTLSLAMIVKNEAQTLERTIQSVQGYVDEIVIGIDTESDDGSADIAARLATTTTEIHLSEELRLKDSADGKPGWGFDKARNRVLDLCKPDNWRLILDGHETVKNPEQMLLALMDATMKDCNGVEVTVLFEPAEDGIPQTEFGSGRILGPDVRYVNSIHNVPRISRCMAKPEIQIEHKKSDQKVTDKVARDIQRSDSTVNGLLKKVQANEKDARSWFYLGNGYKENGVYKKAVEAYEECLKYSVWNEERWHAHYNAGTCYMALREMVKARDHFSESIEDFPAMAEAYYQLGNMAYDLGRFHEAQLWLEKCVQMPVPSARLFIDSRLYRTIRYDKMSMTYHKLGMFEEAIQQAKKVLEATPDNERVQNNINIWEKHLNDLKTT